MSKHHHVFAAAVLAFAASGLSTAAKAGPCVPSVSGSTAQNTCIGTGALSSNTSGFQNTANGFRALFDNTYGSNNTASGSYSLRANTTGSNNTAIGVSSLEYNTTGNGNIATGGFALNANTTGSGNTVSGYGAMFQNTTGNNNIGVGGFVLQFNTTGNNNSAVGYEALYKNTTGNNNIALGNGAGFNLTTGSNNIAIGNRATATDSNIIRIGTQGTQTRTFIAGIRSATVTGGQTVVVNALGQLGVVSSSRRYKQDIQPMGNASNPLMQLRPVTFRYKQAEADGSKPVQYGLIAEEVEQVMPGLVVYNKDGSPESVAYHLLPSLLLNEYQKQGRELTAAKNELAQTTAKLEAMDAELAALKLAVSRFAAAPSPVQLAASRP